MSSEESLKLLENCIKSSESLKCEATNIVKNLSLEELKNVSQITPEKQAQDNSIYNEMQKQGYEVLKDREVQVKLGGVDNSKGKLPDGVYYNDKEVIIGEHKSPKECKDISSTAKLDLKDDEEKNSWNGELKKFEKDINSDIYSEREKAHHIHIKKTQIIKEQIVKDGCLTTEDGKIDVHNKEVKVGYVVPQQEVDVVKSALDKKGIQYETKMVGDNVMFVIKS